MAKEGWKRKRAMRSALSYLYSYRCMGKVGNLLARPPPSLPLPIFNPLFFHRPPLATSSPAINTKNSQGRTAPPRFIAYEFSDLSIAATCLSPVNRRPSPSLSSLLSRFRALPLAVGRYLFPRNKRHESRLPPPPSRYECSSADIRSGCSVPGRDFSISCIFTPWLRYVFQNVFLLFEKTIESYLFGNGRIFVAEWKENSSISRRDV